MSFRIDKKVDDLLVKIAPYWNVNETVGQYTGLHDKLK